MAPLRASVYVAPPIPWHKPNGTEGGPWSPISCTLVYGDTEAVLIDTPITKQQNIELADWIATTIPGIKLKYIYITHGHGDHWFGTNYLLQRFPGVKVIATPGTIQHMKDDASSFAKSWAVQFPNMIDTQFAYADPVTDAFTVNNEQFVPVEVGHTDTNDSTILWVPSIRLAVCGDVVYGDCHQFLAKANTAALRAEWIAAVEKVENLRPELVVPGHMRPGEVPGVWHLARTKQYLRDFDRLVVGEEAKNPRELGAKMTELWPTRFNMGALAGSSRAAFPPPAKKGKL
ncbi:beta-lactamase-like protein [Paraphoma chrysanthemicola]|nr:beta-lactamase-like protein [Paraphoma chrysanthemicola]